MEDHGYILFLGLPSLTSFLSFKEAKKLQEKRLEVGQLVSCRVKDIGENGRTCNVTVGRAEVIGSSVHYLNFLPAPAQSLIILTAYRLAHIRHVHHLDSTFDARHGSSDCNINVGPKR